jgi:hypothetical protein
MEGLVWEASGVDGCLTRVTGVAGVFGEPGDQGVHFGPISQGSADLRMPCLRGCEVRGIQFRARQGIRDEKVFDDKPGNSLKTNTRRLG